MESEIVIARGTYWRLMVVVFIITIGSQPPFLIVVSVPWDFRNRPDDFDLVAILLFDRRRA
jgi:hypothetical protein